MAARVSAPAVHLTPVAIDERDAFFDAYEAYSRELEPFDPAHEPTDVGAYRDAVEDDLAFADSGRELYWITADEVRAGFAVLRHLPDWLAPERLITTIAEFCVFASHRREGIGRAAVLAILAQERARGTYEVEAGILRDNATAHAFWRALGFEVRQVLTVRRP
ncbi:MAG: GNAT family N-acetyltransferase [Dehalococcoidia bacterium]|nr:MAG: GNAT family N-acetyltransferase [Dehalococcoidia bacterium]